jgi:hypothetical protein
MPNAKSLLLWSGSVFLALTLSCAAPSQTTKPESSAPAPTPEQAEVTPTAVQPDVTPTPVPAPVAAVERTLPPADSGPPTPPNAPPPPPPPDELATPRGAKAGDPPPPHRLGRRLRNPSSRRKTPSLRAVWPVYSRPGP